MTDKYKHLRYFCSYFGPSWKTDFGNIDRAMQFFFRTSDTSEQLGVKSDISQFLKEFLDDSALSDALIELGCFYSPSFANLTDREWLGQIQNEIDLRLTPREQPMPPKKPSNGISGKTSDDRLRRQQFKTKLQRRTKKALIRMLIVATLWEIGYRSSKRIHGEANVSRFGGFVSMFRQLFGSGTSSSNVNVPRQNPQQNAPTPKTMHNENKKAAKSTPSSTVELVNRNHALSPSIEQLIFMITLYKRDGWFDTGIPISACDLVDSQIVGNEPDAHILARIADNIRTFQRQENKGSSPNLQVVIFDHAVEAEHVILRNDQVVTLALKLVDNRDKDKVTLRTTLELLYANGGLPETRKREQSLINQFKMTAASH
jgi:CdiI immunity protein